MRLAAAAVLGIAVLGIAPAVATAGGHTYCDAVVVVDNAPLRKSPDPAGVIIAALPTGTQLTLNKSVQSGGYHPGQVPSRSLSGWINAADVAIDPGSCVS